MATAPDKQSSLEIDSTWENQDTKQRLLSIGKLQIQSDSDQALLVRIANTDEYEEVRCGAILRIIDLAELAKLQKLEGMIKESALLQSHLILAGNIETGLSEKARTTNIELLSTTGLKQIALITKSTPIGSKALEGIDDAEDLADLCLFASSVNIRKNAAQKINDEKLLKEIQTKVKGKDKTVSKVISERLSAKTDKGNKAVNKVETKVEIGTRVDSLPKIDKIKKTEKTKTKKEAIESVKPIHLKTELPGIEKEISKLSYKNTTRLYELRSLLKNLLYKTEEAEAALIERAKALQVTVSEKIRLNSEYQEQIKSKTEELLKSLKDALEAGNSDSAIQSWGKIQANISNTANNIRADLQKQADAHKAKFIELRDWKFFAATEKKKRLVAQMQHLIESRMHASDRSKHISKMHKEWKLLGRSNQNESLWKQFKKYSDQAYELCKEYFKQRKQIMTNNLLKRRKICDVLDLEHKRLNEEELNIEELNISALNKLLNKAEQDWKLFAPIEQNKIKNLQKRFYATVNQLRKLRKTCLSANAKRKQELITQAQTLTTLEDNKSAMNEAKRLQQEWKKVGPTSYKEDNKYWQDFRAVCDKVFSKRDQESSELKENLRQVEEKLTGLLRSMDELVNKDDDRFRESRTEYQDLAQEFSNSLDSRLKSQRKKLLEQFNALKRQIDSKYKNLPDKRQQQLMKAIIEKTEFLEQLEFSLLNESEQTRFQACKESVNQESWKGMEAATNIALEKELNQRLENILAAESSSDLAELAKKAEEKLRRLCIQTEIKANVETPSEDKSLRMKIQLEQLQSGFGQAKPDTKENRKYALETELKGYTLGPIERAVREQLGERLKRAIQKLR